MMRLMKLEAGDLLCAIGHGSFENQSIYRSIDHLFHFPYDRCFRRMHQVLFTVFVSDARHTVCHFRFDGVDKGQKKQNVYTIRASVTGFHQTGCRRTPRNAINILTDNR